MSNKDDKFYVLELASNGCHCGRPKKRGQSFCYRCYISLPNALQSVLYSDLGRGYEAAYEAAAAFLDEKEDEGPDDDCL